MIRIFALLAMAGIASGARPGLTQEVSLLLSQETPAFHEFLIQGWHSPDQGAAWTGKDRKDATLRIPVHPGYAYDILLFPQVIPFERFDTPYTIEVLANGKRVRLLKAQEASGMIEISLPQWALIEDVVEVAFRTPLFCPKEQGESPDDRWLGMKVQRVDLLPWKRTDIMPHDSEPCVGIFHDPQAPVLGAPSDPTLLEELLREQGIPVKRLGARDLADPGVLDPGHVDLVLLPMGPSFPAQAKKSFQRYLRHGGSFLSMAGYAFDSLYGESLERELLEQGGFDQGLQTWTTPKGIPGVDVAWDDQEGRLHPGSARLRVDETAPVTWYALTTALPNLEPGTQVALEAFIATNRVRHGAGAYAAISFYDDQGGRISWMDTNMKIGGTGSRDWKKVIGQARVPEGTRKSTVSLLLHGHGIAWFDDVSLRIAPPFMNTRHGKPADFLEVEPDQISVFDAGYPLDRVASVRTASGQFLWGPEIQREGDFTGMAAIGMTGAQWYCTTQEKCRYVALLDTYDRFDRPRGPAGGAMLHFFGLYKGSRWAFFGVDNVDLFSREDAEMGHALVGLIRWMRDGLFLHETGPEFACYRDEEPVKLSSRVSNFGAKTREVTVQLRVRDTQTGEIVFQEPVKVQIEPGQTQSVQATWSPASFPGDLYQVEALLLDQGKGKDIEDTNGFVVWKEEVLRTAPRISLKNNYFHLGQRPLFMTGAQQFWASLSWRTSSPLTISRDFRDMRDYGIRLSRSFMMWQSRPDEEEKRFRDMMVYLAHKHGVVMYHEGTASFPPSTEAMDKERDRARFLAERYGDLPLFLVDHRNEPSLRLSQDPKDELSHLSSQWGDLRSYQIARKGSDILASWSKVLSDEMRKVQPDLLVSVGFLQEGNQASVLKDPLWASEGLDFMNRHFYGPLDRFPSQFKEIDMRYRGVPPSTGEFGSRTHPSGGGNFESKEEQYTRYQFICHYALGLGGAFVCNWHFRDPWESIFSYGVFHQDHVPKDIAKVYRALSLLFSSFEPKDVQPELYVLLPDAHRLAYYPLAEALYRCLNRVMDLRVDFGVIQERHLKELPEACKALLFPLPYLPEEETVRGLLDFVEQGGVLYMSGDLAYDAKTLQRLHTERLSRLCGVEGEPVQDPATERLSGPPALRLTLRGAKAIEKNAQGQPTATLHDVGKGTVLFTGQALEMDAASLASSGLYRLALDKAGIEPYRVEGENARIHVFRVRTRQGEALVLYHRGEEDSEPCHVRLPDPGLSLELAPMKPGWVHMAQGSTPGKKRLLSVQSQGEVAFQGEKILETDTHVLLISLDEQDLRVSQHMALLAFYPGRVRLIHRASPDRSGSLSAQLGELRQGTWNPLCQVPLEKDPGSVTVTLDEESALEILLIGADLEKTGRLVEGLFFREHIEDQRHLN